LVPAVRTGSATVHSGKPCFGFRRVYVSGLLLKKNIAIMHGHLSWRQAARDSMERPCLRAHKHAALRHVESIGSRLPAHDRIEMSAHTCSTSVPLEYYLAGRRLNGCIRRPSRPRCAFCRSPRAERLPRAELGAALAAMAVEDPARSQSAAGHVLRAPSTITDNSSAPRHDAVGTSSFAAVLGPRGLAPCRGDIVGNSAMAPARFARPGCRTSSGPAHTASSVVAVHHRIVW